MFLRLRLAFGIICLPSYSQAQTYTLKQWDSIHVIFFFLIKIRRSMLPRTDIWDFFFFYAILLMMKTLLLAGWCLSWSSVVGGMSVPKCWERFFMPHLFDRSYWGVMSTSTKPFHLQLSRPQRKEGLWSILVLNEELVIGVKLLFFVQLCFY